MSKITIQCPVCKEGEIAMEYWYYPATYEDPSDEGFDIISSTCECEIPDDLLYKALIKELQLNDKAQREQEAEDDRADYESAEEEMERLKKYENLEEENRERF
jgi:hypothetical protein